MPPATLTMTREELRREIAEEIRRDRAWYVVESVLFIILGVAAVALPMLTTLAVTAMVGVFLVLAGAMRFVNGMRFARGRGWRVVSGGIFCAAGAAMLWWPLAGIAVLAAILGALLFAEGILDVLIAVAYRPAHRWGLLLLSGAVSLFLGLYIFSGLPLTGIVFLSVAIGLSMMIYGVSLLMLAWI